MMYFLTSLESCMHTSSFVQIIYNTTWIILKAKQANLLECGRVAIERMQNYQSAPFWQQTLLKFWFQRMNRPLLISLLPFQNNLYYHAALRNDSSALQSFVHANSRAVDWETTKRTVGWIQMDGFSSERN